MGGALKKIKLSCMAKLLPFFSLDETIWLASQNPSWARNGERDETAFPILLTVWGSMGKHDRPGHSD